MQIPAEAAPLLRNVLRLFGGPLSIEETAFEREILCPDERAEVRPALFLDGQLDKVTGTAPDTLLSRQLDQATRVRAVHAATIAYHLRNATVFDGSIYLGRMRRFVYDAKFATNKTTIDFGLAALCNGGAPQFGHWLFDDCLTYLIAKGYERPLCLSTPFGPLPHKGSYCTYFSQDWSPIDRSHVDHLVVFQDHGQNSLKTKRYHALRAKVFKRFPPSEPAKLVYLRRGSAGRVRLIQNESEIQDELVRRGFMILDIVTDSLQTILSNLVSAKLVISLEGSQLSHCCPSIPTGSGILTLQPPDRFDSTHRGWAEALGIQYGFIVGDQQRNGTRFSITELLKTIDLYA
jgi:hypothetical protein